MSTVKGRWGFCPCEYETYRKLKRLCFLLLEAKRRQAAYHRWDAKHPHNRLLYKRTIVTGPLPDGTEGKFKTKEVIGPAPEPELAPFTTAAEDNIIGVSYSRSRYPVETASEVKQLPLPVADIDAYLEKFEDWYTTSACQLKDMVCV